MKTSPKTHDYTVPYWGHAFHVSTIVNGGKRIKGSYHGDRMSVGDYVLLPNGERASRYQITKLRWTITVDDMYFFEAKFAPRVEAEGNER
ncbi:hypothetical protein BH09ACT9_BH09ACT9_00500 [soil metagenome]